MNGGKCRGVNTCRCPAGLGGDHCEIGRRQRSTCKKPCRNGDCMPTHKCRCNEGWFGRACNQSELIYCKFFLNLFIFYFFFKKKNRS